MKKIIVMLLVLASFFCMSCGKKDETPTVKTFAIDMNKSDVSIVEKEIYSIVYICDIDKSMLKFSYDEKVIKVTVDESLINIEGLKEGSTKITISTTDTSYTGTISFNVEVTREPVMIDKISFGSVPSSIELESTATITYTTNTEVTEKWTSSDPSVLEVSDKGVLTPKKIGTAKITLVISTLDDSYEKSWTIEVKEKYVAPTLSISLSKDTILTGATSTLTINYAGTGMSIDNVCVVNSSEVVAGDLVETTKGTVTVVLTGRTKGTASIYVSLTDTELEEEAKLTVKIPDKVAPTISYTGDKDIKLLWGKTFDPMDGVTASDDQDGNITSSIKVVNNVDNKTNGTYTVTYTVEDAAGNKATLTRNVEVYWGYSVKFIGHAGSFYGAQNSLEACEYALKVLKYQALECDLKVTKDGVYVCCHNDALTGTDGKSYTIAQYTLAELQEHKFKESRSGLAGLEKKTYEFDVMTLEDYLLICKKYDAIPIIELKGCNGVSQSDQSGMPALMKLIKDCGMLDKVVFLASAYNTLIWVRNNGYASIPCQYLMSTCDSEDAFNRCVKYNFDISICVTYGNYTDKFTDAERATYKQQWIKRYQDAGCEVSVWTFTQYCTVAQVQEWIDFGVEWVTCDWQPMDQCTMYVDETVKHTVTYLDKDGDVYMSVTVKDGKSAYTPTAPEVTDYEFVEWDTDTTKVTTDLTVKPVYKQVEHKYSITYNLNGGYWKKDPKITGTAVATINSTMNADVEYFDEAEQYSDGNKPYQVYIFLYTATHTQPAKFSYRVYLKLVKDNIYTITGYAASGEAHQTGYDLLLQVSDGNSSGYSAVSDAVSKIAIGDLVTVSGDVDTGKCELNFYDSTGYTGMTVDNYITSYTKNNLPATLPTPTYDGKTFKGWSKSADGTNPFKEIPTGTEEDLTLYAVYE